MTLQPGDVPLLVFVIRALGSKPLTTESSAVLGALKKALQLSLAPDVLPWGSIRADEVRFCLGDITSPVPHAFTVENRAAIITKGMLQRFRGDPLSGDSQFAFDQALEGARQDIHSFLQIKGAASVGELSKDNTGQLAQIICLAPEFLIHIFDSNRPDRETRVALVSALTSLRNEGADAATIVETLGYPSISLGDWNKELRDESNSLTATQAKKIEYLEGLGIQDIAKIIQLAPKILDYSLEENIKPKIQYFMDLGVPNVANAIRRRPQILGLSLEGNIKPTVQYFKELGIVNVGEWIESFPQVLGYSLDGKLKLTVQLYQELEPDSEVEIKKLKRLLSQNLKALKILRNYLPDIDSVEKLSSVYSRVDDRMRQTLRVKLSEFVGRFEGSPSVIEQILQDLGFNLVGNQSDGATSLDWTSEA